MSNLYKYRSIKEFKYFVDIILNNRLFGANYSSLNDPMEGHYFYSTDDFPKTLINRIKDTKQKIGICSLSRTPNNMLMWSHYADGHEGVAIGVEVDAAKYDLKSITYGELPHIETNNMINEEETVKTILSHKYKVWKYEEEERVFIDGDFVTVTVKEILLGSRMKNSDKKFITDLVNKLNPNIKVRNAEA